MVRTAAREIANGDSAPMFVANGVTAPLSGDLPTGLAGRKATLGVRSEHVLAGDGTMGGTVNLIEPLGDATLVFFDYGGSARLVAKVDPDRTLAPGDQLTFAFDAENCHLFDADSGVRLN